MGWDGKEAEWVCWEVFIGTSAVGKEMSVGCNGIWESYFVGQNCIVLAVGDGKFKEDLVRRGDLRHFKEAEGLHVQQRAWEGFEWFPYMCIMKKGQCDNEGC